jgi:hypothetical protein
LPIDDGSHEFDDKDDKDDENDENRWILLSIWFYFRNVVFFVVIFINTFNTFDIVIQQKILIQQHHRVLNVFTYDLDMIGCLLFVKNRFVE